MSKIKIVPKVSRLINIMEMIKKGEIKIPSFQRDYIWGKKQRIDLFESLQLEYPIGAILLWKPERDFKINHEFGPFTVEKVSPNGFFFILDGFQRLSTLFGCLTNPEKTEYQVDPEKKKEFAVYYDLEKEEFNLPRTEPPDIAIFPIYILIDTYAYLDFAEKLRNQIADKEKANVLVERGRKLSSTLIDYQIPFVEIHGGDIEQAVNIFSRVNSKGSPISKDWMVSALTSNELKDFNLGELIENLLNELVVYSFKDLKREVILQCIQNSFGKIYFDIKIEDLVNREDFIEKAKKTINSIKKAVQFLYEELLVLERRLLPYNNQLIFITYFFSEIEDPFPEQKKKLKEWFWITTYSNYFTIYSLSKTRSAFGQFKEFVEGRNDNPVFNDKPAVPFSVSAFPKKVFLGSVRSTATVLFLLNRSNDSAEVNASEIDSLVLNYLCPRSKTSENLVPIIQYFTPESNKFIPAGKYEDLSFLLEGESFKPSFEKLFITEEMIRKPHNEVLKIRKQLIIEAEKQFVEGLNLIYES